MRLPRLSSYYSRFRSRPAPITKAIPRITALITRPMAIMEAANSMSPIMGGKYSAKALARAEFQRSNDTVLVKPEMERRRFPLVSNPPFRARSL